jgi:orotate phosphoribosyltransferase
MNDKAKLKRIIEKKYLHKGKFILSIGAETDIYYDIKSMMCDSKDSTLLIFGLGELLDSKKLKIGSLGGTELGGAILVAMFPYCKKTCYIRKSQRIHGMKKMIEGCPKSPILLVDDVINSTDTVRNAIHECDKAGYDVSGILCVVNRSNTDIITVFYATDSMYKALRIDYPIYSLFRDSDFV